jgi:peroxiredoxin
MPFWIALLAALPVSFELPDSRGKLRALAEWRNRRIVIVAFLGRECPVARQYAQRLNEIARDFETRGISVVGIDANPGVRATDVAAFEKELGLRYPILLDAEQLLMKHLGAARQPEVFVLDQARVVRYRGRVDDQYSPGTHRPRAGRADLVIAIEELLAGKPVSLSRTEPAGCAIDRLGASRGRGDLQVATILNKHCVMCHRPGGIGPFSLATARDARRWSSSIREAVEERRMPPWHADPRYGHFANDPSLTGAERRAIRDWVAAGAPAGDSPPPPPVVSGWTMSTPDVIVSMPAPFSVPASGEIPYQTIEVDPGFRDDVWVQAAEIKPGYRAVVHHATVYLKAPGSNSLNAPGELESFCLCAYATGTLPMVLPEGMAKRVPAGWKLVFVIHYVAKGLGQIDQTSIGLKIIPRPQVRREVATNILLAEDIAIAPRQSDYVVTRSRVFERDVLLLALFPHMHLRGVSFEYEATYPNGRREILLSVPKWDMAWQHRYVLAEPLRLPAGTKLTATAHYDNSAANPNNPDPDVEVRTGPRTEDEMFNGYYDFCLADEAPPRSGTTPLGLLILMLCLVGAWLWLRYRRPNPGR